MTPSNDTGKSPTKKNHWFKILILALIAGLFTLVWILFSGNRKEEAAEIQPPVRLIKPERQTIEQTFEITGHAESESLVHILPRISGTLTDVLVDVGDPVAAGQTVALIDDRPYLLQLQQAEAAFRSYESTWQRVSNLYQGGSATRQNYEEAQAQYEAGKSQYELALLQYEYTKVESPVDGVVLLRHENAGSLVAPTSGRPLVTVGDISRPVVKCHIPERYYHYFQTGSTEIEIRLTVPALNNKVLPAQIKSVSPWISPQSKTFEVQCLLSADALPEDPGLRPGMFLTVSFVVDRREDVLTLPVETLVAGRELWTVDSENIARKREFAAAFGNSELIQVDESDAGTFFIAEGQHFLKDGQRVNVLNAEAVGWSGE